MGSEGDGPDPADARLVVGARPWTETSTASSMPFWLDNPARPASRPALEHDMDADLLVVGGGLSGLWAALLALRESPGRRVVVVEAGALGWAASGRNGGFCAASLTHGLANGFARWPGEMRTLARLGQANLEAITDAVQEYAIDCDFRRSGELDVAVEPWQLDGLAEEREQAASVGVRLDLLDRSELRGLVDSPTYLGGLRDGQGVAMVDPARLVWGLAAAVERLGGVIHERTRVLSLREHADRVRAMTDRGTVRASGVVLATSAFGPLRREPAPYVVPVWDHVIVTEPLSAAQLDMIGWAGREGIGDLGNLFHYYRLTAEDRLLFGGYDALYYYRSGLGGALARHHGTERMLAEHLVATFPALDGIRISHTWGGAIDTCTRFSAFWERTHSGRVVSVRGYTGLGVGASRFGAQVCLDLLAGRSNERTELEMVRRRPLPFPPEPLRWAGIALTRREIARADRNAGRRGRWLRTLDALGLGFDS